MDTKPLLCKWNHSLELYNVFYGQSGYFLFYNKLLCNFTQLCVSIKLCNLIILCCVLHFKKSCATGQAYFFAASDKQFVWKLPKKDHVSEWTSIALFPWRQGNIADTWKSNLCSPLESSLLRHLPASVWHLHKEMLTMGQLTQNLNEIKQAAKSLLRDLRS